MYPMYRGIVPVDHTDDTTLQLLLVQKVVIAVRLLPCLALCQLVASMGSSGVGIRQLRLSVVLPLILVVHLEYLVLVWLRYCRGTSKYGLI